MIDECAIRSMSIQGYNDEIRKLLMTKQEREIYMYIGLVKESTSEKIASYFYLSSQHASGILSKLYKKGYLRRLEQPQESGGYEWRYFQ